MNWDGVKITDYFIGKYELSNPDRYLDKPRNEAFENLYDIELAYKDFYKLCAQNGRIKEEFISALEKVIESPTKSKKAIRSEIYLEHKKNIAKKMKRYIEDNSIDLLIKGNKRL